MVGQDANSHDNTVQNLHFCRNGDMRLRLGSSARLNPFPPEPLMPVPG